MGPRRKKSKPNGKVPAADHVVEASSRSNDNSTVLTANNEAPSSIRSAASTSSSKLTRQESGNHTNNDREDTASRKSWYGGSWKTKSPALAELARDGAAAASSTSLALSKVPSKERENGESPAAKYMERRLGTPRKSAASIATESAVNASATSGHDGIAEKSDQKSGSKQMAPEAPLPPDPTIIDGSGEANQKRVLETPSKDATDKSRPVSGWFGWWSRPDGYQADADRIGDASKANEATVTEARATPLPSSPIDERKPSAGNADLLGGMSADAATATQSNHDKAGSSAVSHDAEAPTSGAAPNSNRSWFGLWSKAENQKAGSPTPQDEPRQEVLPQPPEAASNNELQENGSVVQEKEVVTSPVSGKPASKSSAWAFWSKDKPKEDGKAGPDGTQKQIGEIAVADTPSQSHPEVAQYNEQKSPSDIQESESKSKNRKRKKQTISLESSKSTPAASPGLQPSQSSKSADQLPELAAKEPTITTPTTTAAASVKIDKSNQKRPREEKVTSPPNLLLPSLRSTYPTYQPPSYWDQIRRLIFTNSCDSNAPHHVDLLPPKDVPKIKRALAIGVHGYFPAQFLQMILGQPTGTSIRFANAAATAVQRWAERYQPSNPLQLSTSPTGDGLHRDSTKAIPSQSADIEIEKVALEGEGMVGDRVDALWKLLLNWLDSIQKADFIIVAAHSQGVPVAIQLVAKLLHFACVKEGVRVGVCAMAGINMGPFAELKSRFLAGSAIELFEFGFGESRVRKDYEAALEYCLSKGVRISFIGSLDDQLVSLEVCTTSHSPPLLTFPPLLAKRTLQRTLTTSRHSPPPSHP